MHEQEGLKNKIVVVWRIKIKNFGNIWTNVICMWRESKWRIEKGDKSKESSVKKSKEGLEEGFKYFKLNLQYCINML